MIQSTPRRLKCLHTLLLNKIKPTYSRICAVQQCTRTQKQEEEGNDETRQKYNPSLGYKFPEFLPNPEYRHPVLEQVEKMDMMKRRERLSIPEFYVGSILAVSTSDIHAPSRTTRFVGLCIYRGGYGLRSTFILRNVVDGQGVEVRYMMYSPIVQKIEILRLERRLDDELFYLRDAPDEYSTFPFDMDAEYIDLGAEVPINTIKVPLNPRPWLLRYERMNLKGVILPPLSEKIMNQAKKHEKPWEKYDLMDKYRKGIPEEEQAEAFADISGRLTELEQIQKQEKRQKEFTKKPTQKLF